ncbi:MAG: 3-phosphoglycerate dehydrogenase family protein [Atopobiaceae bacterium]|jgi:D-3-phosphoglycerate dehydrogenase|nr:3-phosphoglycerate dehydrogenase family protein [Atopobiaceae bacterium]MCI2172775.1 3-phosphoglycerate dehydrogenase family protein [Atopobiaceae bacterium]MCI2207082.1 3-phosphoglycerate dehydrogenase family protein [Atopobiaceae bacterium]
MREIKIIDDITKNGLDTLGAGYEITDDDTKADAILMRSTDLHGYEPPHGIRAIARCGAGVNNIPFDEYAHEGIVVFNTPGANANAVKELVIGLIMMTSRDVIGGMRWCRDHASDPDIFVEVEANKKAFVGREAIGRRIGIVGLGNVGSKVANACVDLGMEVYGYDPYLSVEHAWQLSRDVRRVNDLDDLCRGCDYLTIHVPSKDDTVHMIGAGQLALLNDDAVVLNYSRETIIDEPAMLAALESGHVARFATDFATPGTMTMPNTLVTPHAGAGTGEAEENCARMAIAELKDYLENGNIKNSVNYPACDLGVARAGSRIALLHANVPGMLGKITEIVGKASANVQRMTNEAAGKNAYTMFDTDEHLEPEIITSLKDVDSIWRVRVIK